MKSYLITDPKYYTNDPSVFEHTLQNRLLNHTIDFACFRDKTSSNYEQLASIFVKICKKNNIKNIFLNTNYNLAKKLKATGVHLTSSQFNSILEAKGLGLETIISCHNQQEIESAIQNGIDYITYSPIFTTPNKGEPKGIQELQKVCKKYSTLKIFALGGIVDTREVLELKKANPFGFASIRYFVGE